MDLLLSKVGDPAMLEYTIIPPGGRQSYSPLTLSPTGHPAGYELCYQVLLA